MPTQSTFVISRLATAGGSSTARVYFSANVSDGETFLDFKNGINGWINEYNTANLEWIEFGLPWEAVSNAILERIKGLPTPKTVDQFVYLLSAGEAINVNNPGDFINLPPRNPLYAINAPLTAAEGTNLTINAFAFVNVSSAAYQISGVSSEDIGIPLTGVVSFANGLGQLLIPIISDRLTEGRETLQISIGTSTQSISIDDKSTAAPVLTNETHTLAAIVDRGVLGLEAVLLKGLLEKVTLTDGVVTSHTITYGSNTYEYTQVDPLIMTVTRDGDFTTEFKQEISALAPTAANLTYSDAVQLVGSVAIDTVLLHIAGVDGLYVD
jgi:hypothetical protein